MASRSGSRPRGQAVHKVEVTTLDVSKAADSTSLTQLYHTQEGLYRLGKNEKVSQCMATKTTVSNNGKTYVFNLRHDNKWNDGKTVTAKLRLFLATNGQP